MNIHSPKCLRAWTWVCVGGQLDQLLCRSPQLRQGPRFVHDNFEGNACLAIPSKSTPNAFYPVLALPVAKGTLEPAIKDLSNLFNDPTGKCRPEDLRSVASLAASIFEPLAAMHSTWNAHRDVKPSNFLVFSFRPGM